MGFTKKRGIKSNAEAHLKRNKYIVHIDIKDFFPTITKKRIIGLAKSVFNFDYSAALLFSNLVTVNDHLPQGSPCSPILANMVFKRLDKEILYLFIICL